jgi:hypothetical protein
MRSIGVGVACQVLRDGVVRERARFHVLWTFWSVVDEKESTLCDVSLLLGKHDCSGWVRVLVQANVLRMW